ncbi:MAG: tetratricopeptide repeat protein [Pseudomonadota bacterium]|nr:tetratricopeptide repeat protein [Pseudomonadota bacterium]
MISGLVIAATLGAVSAEAFAQSARQASDRASVRSEAPGKPSSANPGNPTYPDATRQDKQGKSSPKLTPVLRRLYEAYEAEDVALAQQLADQIIASPGANAYEQAFAARVIGTLLPDRDNERAAAYFQQAIDLDALNNKDHFETMLMLAQLQMQENRHEQALQTMEAFLAGSRSQQPQHLAIKGNMLYRLKRYPEAITVLKPLVDSSPTPRVEWSQLLMAVYADSGQPVEAARLAERVAATAPSDRRSQLNLAATYMQADQTEQAIAVYERLRAAGQLSEDRDYRNLFALYFNVEGKERDAIAVINEGLGKGVLKPDHQTHVALAQAYYFSGQTEPAIEAYRKAAPLADNGETWLNLAKVLANEGQTAGSKAAAQQALDKGIRNPEDARKLLAR